VANPFLVLGGVAASIIAVTVGVLTVPGWVADAQDAAAYSDLRNIRSAMANAASTHIHVASFDDLDNGEWGTRVNLSGGVELTGFTSDGRAWCATVMSAAGNHFAVSHRSPKIGTGPTPEAAAEDAGCTTDTEPPVEEPPAEPEPTAEELLSGFEAPAEDFTPYTLASSLRSVVNHTLAAAIPGVQLEPGADDIDITPHWRVTNLHKNPAVVDSAKNYVARAGSTIAYVPQATSGYLEVTATGTNYGEVWVVNSAAQDIPATPGESYSFNIRARTLSGTRSVQVGLVWINAANGIIDTKWGPTISIGTTYVRPEVTGVAPAGTAKVGPIFRFAAGTSGQKLALDNAMVWEGDPRFHVEPFTGMDNPGGGYSYEFLGARDNSMSVRIPDIERDPRTLVWQEGDTAFQFLSPLLDSTGFELVHGDGKWALRKVS